MGILTRFKDIMASNVNALLDKCEDPEKMIDQYLRNLENDYAEVKAETASVIAEAKSAQRKVDECNEEIKKMGEYAVKAVNAGNDDDARKFLTKKGELTENLTVLQKNLDAANANAAKMKELHSKLEDDIAAMKAKRDTLKAKVKVAEAQQKINKLGASADKAGSTMAAFDRMEEKINRMTDEADAMAELDAGKDDVDTLAAKYETNTASSSVDDELAALKASLGK
ncbi:MAG: PspA/IM30 family protein [Lachnospiraceae bacterium]|nr:PspA/IM30 family protein [Lachnospiraceae bacterium]